MKKLVLAVFLVFLSLFVYKSVNTMILVSFHDFDEANRAEAARNMKNYSSYTAPLTGSPFTLGNTTKIPAKNNKLLSLTYHLERPPLYFLSMIASTSMFNDSEFFYRLPSLIFGLLSVVLLTIFLGNPISLVAFLTSSDWWLSSQSALMDTSLSFFLFLAFIFLIKSLDKKSNKFLIFSGLSLGGAILSKGQPAIIFIFPLIFLLFTKRINFKQLLILSIPTFITILPWLVSSINKFSLNNFFSSLIGFSGSRALVGDLTQTAPFYWYGRWWLESFRVGWILFITLISHDLLKRNFTYKKSLIIFYFISSFILFSVSKNKVWWYVLPLIPICCLYIGESITYILKKDSTKLFNLSLIIILSAIPIFYKSSNKIAIIYGVLLIIASVAILNRKIVIKKIFINIFFLVSIIFSLLIFLINFPTISPPYPEVKQIGDYYQKLPQPKCLYVVGMPYEASLFYSQAEEIKFYTQTIKLNEKCNNYLLTLEKQNEFNLIFKFKKLKLYEMK